MPNWCEGNIRFRGAMKNIKQFLKNEIVYCKLVNYETVEVKPTIEDKDYMMTITKPEGSWFYIRNTHRNFLDDDVLEIWFDEDDEEKEIIICIDNFKAAWSFERDEAWKEFAMKYNFDVKMTGYEKGMYFLQIKTVFRDGRVKDDIHEYEGEADWMWNCPQPNNGG